MINLNLSGQNLLSRANFVNHAFHSINMNTVSNKIIDFSRVKTKKSWQAKRKNGLIEPLGKILPLKHTSTVMFKSIVALAIDTNETYIILVLESSSCSPSIENSTDISKQNTRRNFASNNFSNASMMLPHWLSSSQP